MVTDSRCLHREAFCLSNDGLHCGCCICHLVEKRWTRGRCWGGPHTTVHQFRSNQPATMQSLCFSLLYSLHHLGFPTLFHFFSYLFLPLTEIPLTLKLYDIFIIIYVLEHVYMVAKSLILSISNKLFIYLYAIEMINIRFKAMCVIFPNSS